MAKRKLVSSFRRASRYVIRGPRGFETWASTEGEAKRVARTFAHKHKLTYACVYRVSATRQFPDRGAERHVVCFHQRQSPRSGARKFNR